MTLLNLLVGVTCFALAAFPLVNPFKLAVFAFAGYLACGGCGVLNCVYDQSVDKLMQRTSKRAIPTGVVSSNNALIFGSVLTAAGIGISYFAFNALTAFMMILGTVFYLVVYTVWLKRSSSLNVVIGGIAGCFAALSGWTAAANTLSLSSDSNFNGRFSVDSWSFMGISNKESSRIQESWDPNASCNSGIEKSSSDHIRFQFGDNRF